jgi:hypothetical protein
LFLKINAVVTCGYFNLFLQVDGHGVETGPDLDEEMEKVFAMAEEDRFDVSRFAASPDSNTSKRSFNEKDYSCK